MSKDFEKKRMRNASGESSVSTDSVTAYIPTPPDGGWGWFVVFASFINHIVVDGIAFTFGVFFVRFQEHFQSSKAQTALVGSLLAGFYLMSGPFASALVNRYGCRAVCIAGSLISATGFVLATFSTSIEMLMVTYGVIGGMGFGFIYLPSIISVSYYFEKRRALATGIAVCGAGVGCFMFAPAGRLLIEKYHWKTCLYIMAVIVLNCTLCGALMRPLAPPKSKPREKNFFDRLIEKHLRKGRSHSEVSTNTVKNEAIMKALQDAKQAREDRLNEGESEMGSLPRLDKGARDSRSPSRSSSIVQSMSGENYNIPANGVPAILVEEDCSEDNDDSEKAKMLRKYSDQTRPVKSKIYTGPLPSEKRNSLPNKTGVISGIPPHMVKEIMNGQARTLNGSLPDVKVQCVAEEHHPLAPNSLLSPEIKEKKCLSAADAHFLSVAPKRNKNVDKEDYARPLYRRDIFYSGSVLHIPQFRSNPNVNTYVASITTIPDVPAPEKESKCWRNIPLPKTAKDILKQMLDCSLLKDPVFMIALFAEVFGFIGLFVPFVYITERAVMLGVKDTDAAFLLSVIGITNTVGRVLSGWLADFERVNSLALHNVMMILGGIACIVNMFAVNYTSMVIFCAFFGLSVAAYISLTSIILCDIIGLERLTAAFGFLTLVRGIASVAGPPVAGAIFDWTQNYDWSFHVGGSMFLIAGGLYSLLHLPSFARDRQRRIAKMQGVPFPEDDDLFTSLPVVITDSCDITQNNGDIQKELSNTDSDSAIGECDRLNKAPSGRKISFA